MVLLKPLQWFDSTTPDQQHMTHNFLFFWGRESPFSNWYASPFEHDGTIYNCSEQYMMHRKAHLFSDRDVANLIMTEKDPRKHKMLGREVRGYNDPYWLSNCDEIMFEGLVCKFTQNAFCKKTLLDAKHKIIVEASPYDKLWGIGLSANDPRVIDKSQWLGENRLGNVLMRTRDFIETL